MTSFFISVKHLPPEVVTRKFQDRRWEVDKHGKDLCPKCIDRHRTKAARKIERRKARALGDKVTPEFEQYSINAATVRRVVAEAGFAGIEVEEFEGRTDKFLVKLGRASEVKIGRINHAERLMVTHFDAELDSSYLKPHTDHVNGGTTVTVTVSMHWIVAFSPRIHEPIATEQEILATMRATRERSEVLAARKAAQ